MKSLVELEKKVMHILENNKKLQEECATLHKEKADLQEANTKLENLLLKENGNVDSLNKEKDALKIAIENLLESIDKFSVIKE